MLQLITQLRSFAFAPKATYTYFLFNFRKPVKRGIKTGTASAEELYKIDNEPIPTEGEYSVILNSRDEAVCVIRTTKVYIVPFCDVSAHHAFCEGEGDRSLAYWRKVHEEFFRNEYAACGLEFSQDIPVVCEEFELLMKAAEC